MAENEFGEKTEEPTEKRRQDAREEGNVAKSSDMNAAAIMLAAIGGLFFLAPGIGQSLAQLMHNYLSGPPLIKIDKLGVTRDLWDIFEHVIPNLLPFALLMFCTALMANIMQVGFLFSPKSLALKWNRLNPVSGFQRIASIASLVKLGTNLGKIVVLAIISIWFIYMMIPNLQGLIGAEPNVLLGFMGRTILELGLQLAIALLVLAILDFSFQKWKYEQDLKMTKQEVREEMKNMEGDPHTRQRRKEAHRKLATARELNAVRDADVVVTNPTHISVALKYDPEKHPAPVVVAKGADALAMKIREIAREHNVPIIERKPLARALYHEVKVGHPIPSEMYEVFVEIMAYVYRLTGRPLPT